MSREQTVYEAHKQSGLLLNANEASENLSETLIEELQEMLPEILFNRYPEDSAIELRKQYGRVMNLPAEMILAGNGSDQMLQLMITAFLNENDSMFTLAPDFSMYDFYASGIGADVKRYELFKDGMFDAEAVLDVDEFITQARESNARLVMFSNPNNPSGLMISKEDVRKIALALGDVPLLMDEAYMEFGQDSALDLLTDPAIQNLYITRTLSKAYALAGLRVGFLISTPENIERMNRHRPVYNLNSFSAAAAGKVLEHAVEFQKKTEQVVAERERMEQFLSSLESIEYLPSKGNFICLTVKADPQTRAAMAAKLAAAFEEAGITIRDYRGKDYIRITIGLPDENDQTMAVLEKFCRKPGIRS